MVSAGLAQHAGRIAWIGRIDRIGRVGGIGRICRIGLIAAARLATALLIPVLLCPGNAARAQAVAPSAAAQRLVDATPVTDRTALRLPFSDAARSDWHYTPRSRDGLVWKAMSPAQREASTALLRSALSDSGLAKVRALMSLEIALRELENFGPTRDPENYAFAIYGEPGAPAWGWRIEGHHLSLHFTLSAERYVATLPQFFGANPALVPRDTAAPGPRKGFRLLGAEEDLARQWLEGLSAAQRRSALFEARPFGDIVTRNAARVSPLAPVGLEFAAMNPAQQALVLKLIGAIAEHLQPELAEARLARVRAGTLESIRVGWAGGVVRGEPHYLRIQGATFLIEFDNSGGNHIHTVWRDFSGDWGRDVLAEHYRRAGAEGTSHKKP
ncbi:MAG: DUF3500 domain-containing protein [Burkholderiaceae bacterium]